MLQRVVPGRRFIACDCRDQRYEEDNTVRDTVLISVTRRVYSIRTGQALVSIFWADFIGSGRIPDVRTPSVWYSASDEASGPPGVH